uniref:Nudix hydrolase 2-like n=1 Tax=Tetraselmis sp. GSL018 TaxID=582737 RepID=A0A061R3E1_9CHLO|mmetsp:Transcript_23397/g.55981  ORF Transcript_23397/g.55981 Transcript_23397/m.55981 type:complete len:285 (-) Transcript_23397:302-1156(-)|eukprot:CAMPEP_0177605274 /NCGR_PEP_ID=MMETSP0419_2-20121207/16607_1 /TAXON_ID=582737 /ORGANISM="Tetraselmis sp., Strain GSL018" /LENGTH=284 /DNA_ID=CAMNT_0019099399 /DNA_START=429 /DNA_END=1283 /DNA_ORIENTATION=+
MSSCSAVDSSTLSATGDSYGGVVVHSSGLPKEPQIFKTSLQSSLKVWRRNGTKGVWLKLPIEYAALVPEAVEQGFIYHHAEADYVMLCHWLQDSPSTLPPNASHQVGVGAFVLNDRGEVLAVQEGNGPLKGKGAWKMPTGIVSTGEDLHEGACREVLEETGIDAEFQAVLAVRQAHGFGFGKSDLFFVCAMRPKPGPQELKPCETEIETAAWIPLEEFLQIGFMRSQTLYAKILDACEAWAEGRYHGLKAKVLEAGVWKPREDLLLVGKIHRKSSRHLEGQQQK